MPLSPSWSQTLNTSERGELVENAEPGFHRLTDDAGRVTGHVVFYGTPLEDRPRIDVGDGFEPGEDDRVARCPFGTVLLDSDGDAIQYFDSIDGPRWATTYGSEDIESRFVCLPATVIYVP